MMDANITFLVAGSAAEPYEVQFSRRDGILISTCTCAAASNGQACKHRTNIVIGVCDGISGTDVEKMSQVAEWLRGSSITAAVNDVIDAESHAEAAKKNLAAAKKKLSAALLGKPVSGK